MTGPAAEGVTITVDWTPAMMAEANRVFTQSLNRRVKWWLIVVFAACAGVGAAFGPEIVGLFRGPAPGLGYNRGYTDGMIMVIGAAFLGVVGMRVAGLILLRRQTSLVPFFERPWTIEVSLAGIRTKGPYNAGRIDWLAVVDVLPGRTVTVISLGRGGFLPIPDVGLPSGMTPGELRTQLALWHNAAEF